MGGIEHEKLFSPQDQFHIISRSAQTNGFSIGFTMERERERLISPAPFCGSVYVPEQKAIHLKTLSPNSPKNIKAHMVIS